MSLGEGWKKHRIMVDANRWLYEMCPIYADFKHFMRPNHKNFA
jgi:hypothetical protein